MIADRLPSQSGEFQQDACSHCGLISRLHPWRNASLFLSNSRASFDKPISVLEKTLLRNSEQTSQRQSQYSLLALLSRLCLFFPLFVNFPLYAHQSHNRPTIISQLYSLEEAEREGLRGVAYLPTLPNPVRAEPLPLRES